MTETVATAAVTTAAVASGVIPPVLVTEEVMRRWFHSPLAFALECLRFAPDEWQRDVLLLVEQSPKKGLRIALMACKGPGKSAVLAILILWYLFTRPRCKIIVTSITGKNLEDGLWSELSKWGEPLKSTFEFDKKRIAHKKYGETWFVSARTWPKDASSQDQADSLAGPHADYNLFVMDEVSEYPEGVVAAAEGMLATGIETLMMAAGNCTKTVGSPLFRFATTDTWSPTNPYGWHVYKITGDPDSPKCSPRIDKDFFRKLIALWGRDHPIVRTNVLAEFPLAGTGAMLSEQDVRDAQKRNPPEPNWKEAARVIGVDVARYGIDKTVFQPRQGIVAFQPEIYGFVDRNFYNQATALINLTNRFDADKVLIEINGMGVGLYDAVTTLDHSGRFVPVDVTATEGIDKRYHNLRAQMHFTCAEWVKGGASLPEITELVAEGAAPTYHFNKQTGKIVIDDKDVIKEVLGHSPDYWDALCLSHSYPVIPRRAKDFRPKKRQDSDYNPFLPRRAA